MSTWSHDSTPSKLDTVIDTMMDAVLASPPIRDSWIHRCNHPGAPRGGALRMETNEKERDDVAAILARCPEKISNIEQLYGQAPQPTLF